MAEKIFTYRQVPSKAVECYWTLNGVLIDSGRERSKLDGWQKNANIDLSLDVDFNKEDVSSCIRHDCGASFFVTFHSRSDLGGTSIRGLVCRKKYDQESNHVTLNGVIPGEKVAGVITLELLLCIDEHKSDFAAEVSGEESVLASGYGEVVFDEAKDVILEGESTYFPIADIDFSKEGFDGNALYFLKRNPLSNLDSDFFSSYRLYFNNLHPAYSKINDIEMTEGNLLGMMTYDIYHSLVLDALDALYEGQFSMQDERNEHSHTVRTVYINMLETLQYKYLEGLDPVQMWDMTQDTKSDSYCRFICALQAYLLDLEADK